MEVEWAAGTPSQLRDSRHSLQLLTENTPNGKKAQILLEELRDVYGLSWATHLIDLDTDEQKKDWFLRLNPNGRIPVLLDTSETGQVISIMESQAILVYLQETYDKDNVFGFTSAAEKSQLMQWLFFWHSSAPVQAQARHFAKGVKEPIPYAANRFREMMLRIYSVLEAHLSGQYRGEPANPRDYLAGHGRGKFTIADIGTWPHVRAFRSLGFSEENDMQPNFPHLLRWIKRIECRPGVLRGTDARMYDSEENPGLVVRAQ